MARGTSTKTTATPTAKAVEALKPVSATPVSAPPSAEETNEQLKELRAERRKLQGTIESLTSMGIEVPAAVTERLSMVNGLLGEMTPSEGLYGYRTFKVGSESSSGKTVTVRGPLGSRIQVTPKDVKEAGDPEEIGVIVVPSNPDASVKALMDALLKALAS